MSPTIEKREVRDFVEVITLRAAPEGSKSPGTLVGYSAVFNKYSADLGYFREVIKPGAFTKALKTCDCRALLNHNVNNILGRSSAGTLRLTEDELGLKAEIDLPDTSIGRDTAELVTRRDIQGQSFAFTVSVDQFDWSGETVIRTIIEIEELYDVGPVCYPAYSDTSVAMRAFQSEKEKRDKPTPPPIPQHVIQASHNQNRLRLLEHLT